MAPGTDPQAGRAVAFFDLFNPDFRPDGPAVDAAREACWYARTPLGYAVLRYAEAAALLRDRRLRQGGVESLAAQGVTEGPLAARVVAQGAQALNPRGQLYTHANIHDHLTMRHVRDERRQSGVDTGGPAPFGPRDRQAFANQLDRWLTRAGRTGLEATC